MGTDELGTLRRNLHGIFKILPERMEIWDGGIRENSQRPQIFSGPMLTGAQRLAEKLLVGEKTSLKDAGVREGVEIPSAIRP